MAKPGISMDGKEAAKLNKAFRDLAKISDKPVADLLRQEGRLFAVALAEHTARPGKSPSAGKKHEEQVRSRIRGVYSYPQIWVKIVSKTAGFKAGERFGRLVQRRNIAEAEKMLNDLGLSTYRGKRVRVILFDGGKRHKASIEKGGKPSDFAIVCDFKKIDQYIKRTQKRVGNLKSGWARAAEMLGGSRGIPAWAKGKSRKHDNIGKGTVTGSKDKKVLFLFNGYAKKVPDAFYGKRAIRDRVIKLKIRLKKEIKLEQKRLNRKYK